MADLWLPTEVAGFSTVDGAFVRRMPGSGPFDGQVNEIHRASSGGTEYLYIGGTFTGLLGGGPLSHSKVTRHAL